MVTANTSILIIKAYIEVFGIKAPSKAMANLYNPEEL